MERLKELNNIEISKFLSYILRHKPESIGIGLSKDGWANVQEIIEKSNMDLSSEIIEDVVNTNDKKRFSLNDDKTMIRASQGHSFKDVNISFEKVIPPTILYHGTSIHSLKSIMKEGLRPMSRQYVHLSTDKKTAIQVGKRHCGIFVLFEINTTKMVKDNIPFYKSENGVILVKEVPSKYLIIVK